ncbi:PD-(D/E)XK nuclease superfamily protein [Candidatus Methanoperedenaceae archaeon GB37]|nr:PD-(D/E)XK nuclease superfamily protein [Candidatus Methanoperedenaceae archaeon GB37]
MAYKLSPSSINLMLECPRCFWLQLVKKIKRPEGIFPSLPGGMDRILKRHFDKFMERGELPPEIREYGLGNGYKLFSDKTKLEIWRSVHKGIQYKDKTSGILIRGAVDNLLEKGKKLIVLDYKTRGYPLKEDTHEHYQTQMDIYNFLLRKNGYETENYAYLLFYYPTEITKTGEVIFDTKLIKIPTDARRGEKVFKKAIEILEGPIPKPSENCEFCKWGANTLKVQ